MEHRRPEPAHKTHIPKESIIPVERVAPRDLPIQTLESIHMSVEIRKAEYHRERFLDTKDPSERPLSMELFN